MRIGSLQSGIVTGGLAQKIDQFDTSDIDRKAAFHPEQILKIYHFRGLHELPRNNERMTISETTVTGYSPLFRSDTRHRMTFLPIGPFITVPYHSASLYADVFISVLVSPYSHKDFPSIIITNTQRIPPLFFSPIYLKNT